MSTRRTPALDPASTAYRALRITHRGFTLAEVVVALTLLASGALALVAATAAAVRAVGAAEAQLRATTTARSRAERLASAPCADLVPGSSVGSADRVRESWSVTHGRNGVRLVTDSVIYSDRGAVRTFVLHRLVVC
jgi:prepilin-type N-terminal cleavage/methylation domain-containing protein